MEIKRRRKNMFLFGSEKLEPNEPPNVTIAASLFGKLAKPVDLHHTQFLIRAVRI